MNTRFFWVLIASLATVGCSATTSEISGTDTGAEINTDTGSSSDTGTETEAGTETDTETDTGTDTDSDTQTGSSTETDTDTDEDTDTSTDDDTDTGPAGECVEGQSREGPTSCGFNSEGVLIQVCQSGTWVDTDECTGTDVCVNGTSREGDSICGFNSEGVYLQTCTSGTWQNTTECTGTDECLNGSVETTSEACGLNNEGLYTRTCENGAWGPEVCSGTDVCVNGATEMELVSCGASDGVRMTTCESGVWVEDLVCPSTGGATHNALGRTMTMDSVNLGGTGTHIATVLPGSSVSLAVSGTVLDSGSSCDTCVTQFYVRLNGVFSLCLGSSTESWSFNESTSFVAPTAPGIYFINPASTWDYNCVNSTSVATTYSDSTLAILIVADDAPVCTDGDEDHELIECDSGQGVALRTCVDGAWSETELCPSSGTMTYTTLGRTMTVNTINLQGTGMDVAAAEPGSTVSFRMAGSVVDSGSSCDGCITQFYARMNGVFGMCLGSSTGDWSFDETTSFTAPSTPGVYFINPSAGWDYQCNGDTSVSTTYSESTLAVLVVQDGVAPEGPCSDSGLTAGTGTVTTPAFNDVFINWASAYDETFTFPAAEERFRSATMYMTIECPPGGCDPWDRYGSISLKHSSGETHEIGRFITPYDIGTGIGGPGSCPWSFDVTPFMHLLRGEQELSLFIASWIGDQRGWQVSVSFEFERGVPELEAYRVVNLWDLGHLVYGNPNNPITDHLIAQTVSLDEETVAAKVRVGVTGHGQGNTDNAAEFSYRWHRVDAGAMSDQWTPWRSDCASNTCSPQGGNWTPGRAGWCPGDRVVPRDIDVTSQVTAGGSMTLGYSIEPYENCCRPDNPSCNADDGNCCIYFAGECGWNYTGHTEPNFDLNAQLILYRCPQ